MSVRKAGLRGRNTPTAKLPLRWAHEYLKASLPTPVFPIDVSEGIVLFGMQGNDIYGNCVPACEVHYEMTTAAAAGVVFNPSPDLAVQRYNDADGNLPAPGPGTAVYQWLMWCYKQGYILGWAPVDRSNTLVMQGLMQAGFGLMIGVALTANNETQFNEGIPWDPSGEMAEDGHCVLWVKSDTPTGMHSVVTWGKVQQATQAWLETCFINCASGEAALVVTTEEQMALFEPALAADCAALGGGQVPPAPVPVPVPVPPVPPAPVPNIDPRGDLMLHTVTIPTDANGNGWMPTSAPWSTFQAISIEGSDPDPAVDDRYFTGTCHVQDRGGCVLASVTGCPPLSPVNVFILATM